MNFKINIDFCVINNPYNTGARYLLFVSYHGANKIDETLCLEEDYELIRKVLEKYGYIETDFCAFESSNNSPENTEEMKQDLIDSGMRYSKPFEFNVKGELDSFHSDLIRKNETMYIDFGHGYDNSYLPATSNDVFGMPKFKVPKIGGKIKIHFYLFLQCHWVSENDCVLELVGDLYSRNNNNNRNFLQIVSSEFIRLESNVPNSIVLQSTKSYGDFVNEINFLHKGAFRFIKPSMSQNGEMVTKIREFIYNIMEIKKNINPIHKIVIEVNLNKYYDDMISASKTIKKELTAEKKTIISIEEVKPEMLMLKEKLKTKMEDLSNSDEFEKANVVKNDIVFIENKLKIADTLEEGKITLEEYYKNFCLNS